MHPHQLHAAAALWSLRRALRHLQEHRETVLIRRPQLGSVATRPRSLAALQRYDDLVRAERADRPAGSVLNGSAASLGGAAAPGDAPGMLDLERDVERLLTAVTEQLAAAHAGHPLLAWSTTWPAVIRGMFHIHQDPRWTYVSVGLAGADVDLAEDVGRQLAIMDRRIRAIAYAGRDEEPLPGGPPCPACGERRLRWQTSAPHWSRWTITCVAEGCTCRGDGDPRAGDACTCGMPTRIEGLRHIWPGDQTFAPAIRPGRIRTTTAALAA